MRQDTPVDWAQLCRAHRRRFSKRAAFEISRTSVKSERIRGVLALGRSPERRRVGSWAGRCSTQRCVERLKCPLYLAALRYQDQSAAAGNLDQFNAIVNVQLLHQICPMACDGVWAGEKRHPEVERLMLWRGAFARTTGVTAKSLAPLPTMVLLVQKGAYQPDRRRA